MSRISDHIVRQKRSESQAARDRKADPTTHFPSLVLDDLRSQGQALLAAIMRSKTRRGEPVRVVGLTSCYRREGVSTIAALLARAASGQRRILLIDANPNHSTLADRFNVQQEPGLIEAVSGKSSALECIQDSSSGVAVCTAGSNGGNASSFLAVGQFLPLVQSMADDYDLVLIDLPAVSGDASIFELCGSLDGIALVVEAQRVHRQAAQRTIARLRQSGAHLLGTVLNKRRDYIPDWLYRVL